MSVFVDSSTLSSEGQALRAVRRSVESPPLTGRPRGAPAPEWTEDMKVELRRAHRAGKYAAAHLVFPTVTRSQLHWAICRYVHDYETATLANRATISPTDARRKLADFDREAFLEGIVRLLRRTLTPTVGVSAATDYANIEAAPRHADQLSVGQRFPQPLAAITNRT